MSPLHSCSICSATFAEGEGLTLDVSSTGSSRRIGGYCRVRCRDAARALLALGALEVGASPERQARREMTALLSRVPRTAVRHRDSRLEEVALDLVLAGGGAAVVRRRHGPLIGSDHWPVIAEIQYSRLP